MAFDTSVITEVFHSREGSRLTLEWKSTVQPGTFFQIYVQGALAWWGDELYATVPAPRVLVDIQIGSVGPGEQTSDLSDAGFDALGLDALGLDVNGLLRTPITTRAFLSWTGFGAAQYQILEGALGFDHGGLDLGGLDGSAGTLVGTVAGLEGISTDGLDVGAFDADGLDYVGGNYSWTSDPLTRGTWNFSVVPIDTAGNAGTPSLVAIAITSPPRPPAPNSSGKRLTYVYNASTHVATLNWLASLG